MGQRRRRGSRHPAAIIDIVSGPDEFRLAAGLIALANRDHRRRIMQAQREWLGETWKTELDINARLAGPRARRLILAGARVKAGNPPVLIAGNSKRPMSRRANGSGLTPIEGWRLAEWGTASTKQTTYERRSESGGRYVRPRGRGGPTHEVTRNTLAGWPTSKTGHVIGPTVRDVAPRILSYFIQTVVRTYLDALDRKD